MIHTKTWSKIENLNAKICQKALFSNNYQNLGIHYHNGELWSSGYAGICRLVDRFGGVLKGADGNSIVVSVEPNYEITPFEMLAVVMSDDEYEDYIQVIKKEKKELFHIFLEQESVETCLDGNSGDFLVAASFVTCLKQICRRKLKPQMIKHNENLKAKAKGKIDIKRQLKTNVFKGREDRMFCTYNIFSVDTVENRILKFSLKKAEYILKIKYSKAYAQMKKDIKYCKNALADVSDVKVDKNMFSMISINGLYSYYKDAMGFAKQLVSNLYIAPTWQGGRIGKVIPYVINMELLFEFYIRSKMKEYYINIESYSIGRYNQKYTFLKGGILQNHLIKNYIPDIVVLKDSKPIAVFDVKYKNRLKPDRYDTHQLMSYVLMLHVNKCGFIFPVSNSDGGGLVIKDTLNISSKEIEYFEIEYNNSTINKTIIATGCC